MSPLFNYLEAKNRLKVGLIDAFSHSDYKGVYPDPIWKIHNGVYSYKTPDGFIPSRDGVNAQRKVSKVFHDYRIRRQFCSLFEY